MRGVMFAGQGWQVTGMGEDLFSRYPAEVALVNEVLGYDLAKLCLSGGEGQLNQTRFTQPAVFLVSALAWLDYVLRSDCRVVAAAGHSLGEYNALFAAGAIDLAFGMELVKQRAELMSQIGGGGLMAVMGLIDFRSLDENRFPIANYNTPDQLAIAFKNEDLADLERLVIQGGARRYVVLDVSGPFHSPWMSPAAEKFADYLMSVSHRFKPPKFPVYSNVSGDIHRPADLTKHLAQQIDHPVRWQECVRHMLRASAQIDEVSPTKLLTKMLKKIRQYPHDLSA